ncbi:MAG: ATP-binding cassette domain-containing protein [Acidimicrobiia bacterium]|nr:ATP-binding cassette domain-containing protein [Acidimicrobiia bacterium]NNC75768.1 ABC transporter ATP-binding protein [Acidimicrobiia bacterium]
MLELNGLSKRFGDVVALDGCTFSLRPGQLLGFLGPNGAGKTTAMRSVFGLVRPDFGAVHWHGEPVTATSRLRFGYMPEQRGLYPRMKVHDQLIYFGRLHGMERTVASDSAMSLLEELGLGDRADDRLEELSHGNQQRVQLAAALVHDPEVLVLDEPFSGLDPLGVESLAGALAERADAGAAVMFSSHQLDLVEDLCEDVVIINRGTVVLDGPVRKLRSDSPVRYLDVEVKGSESRWIDTLENIHVITRDGDRTRVEVHDHDGVSRLAAAAEAAGEVVHFAFEPPNLSEVFRRAVGQ